MYAKRPNVILITLDTTRMDHLGCYGYHRRTSPNIDKLAEESVLYTRAITPSSWTLPSHASLFTGKFTTGHGAKYDINGPLRLLDSIEGPDAWNAYRARGLSIDESTLAGILKEDGYVTGAVVAGPWMKKIFGLNKGFDHYDDAQISELNGRTADQVTENAVNWIRKVKDNNFFLFLNYFDAHAPYMPPKQYDVFTQKAVNFSNELSNKEGSILHVYNSRYDGEILYMDYHIGQLFKMLKSENLFDNTLFVVTSDHGELIGEHGLFGHGNSLYQEELHIPLIIKYPGADVKPKQDNSFVQLNDVFAIILQYIGIERPGNIQSGIPPEIGHPVIAEVYPVPAIGNSGSWRAIYDENYKFLWNSSGNHILINLKKDPEEKVNLILKEMKQASLMYANLSKYLAMIPPPGPIHQEQTVDEETRKALRSLRYLQ
jgi:arylsulfatase A-like enzyme